MKFRLTAAPIFLWSRNKNASEVERERGALNSNIRRLKVRAPRFKCRLWQTQTTAIGGRFRNNPHATFLCADGVYSPAGWAAHPSAAFLRHLITAQVGVGHLKVNPGGCIRQEQKCPFTTPQPPRPGHFVLIGRWGRPHFVIRPFLSAATFLRRKSIRHAQHANIFRIRANGHTTTDLKFQHPKGQNH